VNQDVLWRLTGQPEVISWNSARIDPGVAEQITGFAASLSSATFLIEAKLPVLSREVYALMGKEGASTS
jgi:hypothetical protein